MDKPNYQDVELILKFYELRREKELRKARKWFDITNFFNKVKYAKFKKKLLSGCKEDRYIRMVAGYWNMVATIVNSGLINEELFFKTNSEDIKVWKKIEPFIEEIRKDLGASYYRDLQNLVERHLVFIAHNDGKEIAQGYANFLSKKK